MCSRGDSLSRAPRRGARLGALASHRCCVRCDGGLPEPHRILPTVTKPKDHRNDVTTHGATHTPTDRPSEPGRTSRATITLAALARRISRPALDALSTHGGAPSSPHKGLGGLNRHPAFFSHRSLMASWAPALFGDALVAEGGTEVNTEDALKDKIVGVYFSAHWCVSPPPPRESDARAHGVTPASGRHRSAPCPDLIDPTRPVHPSHPQVPPVPPVHPDLR